MKPLVLPRAIFDQMADHALAAFPEECCGIVVRRAGAVEVVRVTNVQNEKHVEDPERFPRTAATAFTMGAEAVPVLLDHDRRALVIEAFYHSHPQHAAYFSEEDRRQATVWDEASYPEAGQIVLSVFDREVKDAKGFRWAADRRDFVEVELQLS